jgi:predicted phage-related endonuclease
MSINELDAKVKELRELRRMAEELQAEMDSITDELKRHMDDHGMDTLLGMDWKATYKTVTTARIDTTSLKRELPDIAQRFTKASTTRRFTVA